MFDPMTPHLLQYDWAMAQYFGYGVAACYRGPRLYDSVRAMLVVKKWVNFYNMYRDIIIGDIIHVRRPDMQGRCTCMLLLCSNRVILTTHCISGFSVCIIIYQKGSLTLSVHAQRGIHLVCESVCLRQFSHYRLLQ